MEIYLMRWCRPSYTELKMDAEIGSYQEDGDPPRVPDFVVREPLATRSAVASGITWSRAPDPMPSWARDAGSTAR
jgi:hypothetical protein